MPASTNVNNRTVVHKKSTGITTAFPDVCKTPTPGGPVPIPYPNISFSKHTSKGSKTVKVDKSPIMLKKSVFSTSTGDEPGTLGGIISGCFKGKAEFINYSFDVKVEGKNVPRLGDPMKTNQRSMANTAPFPEVQPPNIVIPDALVDPESLFDLPITFAFKHSDAGSGKKTIPQCQTGHELNGPKKGTKSATKSKYQAHTYNNVPEGDYKIKFDKFDMEKRVYKPKSE